jgi:hypothetical protein
MSASLMAALLHVLTALASAFNVQPYSSCQRRNLACTAAVEPSSIA